MSRDRVGPGRVRRADPRRSGRGARRSDRYLRGGHRVLARRSRVRRRARPRRAGLPLRVHADQLGPSGAAEAAVGLGARSADHLNHLSPAGVDGAGPRRRHRRRAAPRVVLHPRRAHPAGRRAPRARAPRSPSPPTSIPEPRPCRRCPRRSRSPAPSYGLTPLGGADGGDRQPGVRAGDGRPARARWRSGSAPTCCCWRTSVRAGALPARPRPVVATIVGGELVA